jgi:short-subunit dehydrogenase
LVNNPAAAIAHSITEVTDAQQRNAHECNVIAPLSLAQAAVPGMRQAGMGWIVNLTSVGARLPEGPPFYLGPQGSTMELYGATRQRSTASLQRSPATSMVQESASTPWDHALP